MIGNTDIDIHLKKAVLLDDSIAWIDAQISGGSGIWSGFTYDKKKFEVDTGRLLDALIYDIKYCVYTREYTLEYIFSEDRGRSVDIMKLVSRNIQPLIRRVRRLAEVAALRRKKGEFIDNWFGV